MSCVARCQWSGSYLAVCRFIDAIVEIFTANDIMQCTHLRGNPKARFEAMIFSDRTPGGRRQFVEDAFMQYALETGGGPDVVPQWHKPRQTMTWRRGQFVMLVCLHVAGCAAACAGCSAP